MAHLGEDEVKNVQTSMSYGLYAESHSTAYVRACRKAINQVLLSLNPETEAANIERLHDVKQMLRGVAMAIEQSVQMFIYVHAGLTAQLRSNFLQAQGNYLPTHVKQGLLHELFGGSALFNTQIAKYVENVDKHNNKFHQNKMNAAVVKSLTKDPLPSFQIPKLASGGDGNQSQSLNSNRGRGGHRGGGPQHQNRGGNHGNQFQRHDTRSQGNRGGQRGGKSNRGRGAKGGKN